MNWDQLKTILWLRWRLARNQWARSKGVSAVIAGLIAVGVGVMGATTFAVGLVSGIYGLGQAKPTLVWGIWCGLTIAFLFIWMIGLMAELQRSESIDLQKLMHLPVRLGQMFVINYIASHLAVSIVLVVPAMMGLALGLAISRGAVMILLAPLALSMIFMVSAWTYCLRGWLATLMSNPRQRRNVVMIIMGTFILLCQAPNLYFNVYSRFNQPSRSATGEKSRGQGAARKAAQKEKLNQIISLQKYVPPFWLPLGAQTLAEDNRNVGPALLGTAGCLALGGLGLRRAYRGTLKFYRGDASGKAAPQARAARSTSGTKVTGKAGAGFLEWRPRFVPEQAAALGLATFRSLLRAPEVKMAWGTSMLVPLIAGGSILFNGNLHVPEPVKPFIATASVMLSMFMLVQFFANQFGFDREGFRALVLCPADRKLILLGKNLACLPVGAGFATLLLLLVAVRLQLPPMVIAAGLFQLASALMLVGMAGNLLSIMVPYRIQAGTMKPTKMPAMAMFILMLSHMFFPLAMSPVFLPPLAGFLWQHAGWPIAGPVNLILSAVMAGALGLAYWHTLAPMGQLLQTRETKILGIVTVEVE